MDITKIIPRYNDMGGHVGWSDPENHRHYFRVWGGVAWPCNGSPGFIVLLAEETHNLRSTNPAKLYGLLESTHPTPGAMLSKCAELSSNVDLFYSNTIPIAQRILLHEFNQRQERKRLSAIQLLNVPMLSEAGDAEELFRYADSMLLELTWDQKAIFLGECPKVRGGLQNVPAEWTPEDVLKLPEVTALYYVLGAMLRLPYSIPTENAGRCITEYDVFKPIPGADVSRTGFPSRPSMDPFGAVAWRKSEPETRPAAKVEFEYDPLDQDW